jgi:hypothetical protein
MANQFIAGRFDAMIVLDSEAIEKAMKDINFTDYSYANYRYVPKSATTMACRRKAFGLGKTQYSLAGLTEIGAGETNLQEVQRSPTCRVTERVDPVQVSGGFCPRSSSDRLQRAPAMFLTDGVAPSPFPVTPESNPFR